MFEIIDGPGKGPYPSRMPLAAPSSANQQVANLYVRNIFLSENDFHG